jgi:hypothetical protein
MSSLTLADAKQLCTANELRLVTSSMGNRLESFDSAGLKKNIVEARKLRDKWRDQATTQRRETQRAQGSRTSDKNARSDQKAQLFDEALTRFTDRLALVEASPELAGTPPKTVKPAPTKRQRSQEHRESRADVRDALREKKQMLNESKATPAAAKKAPKKTAKKPAPNAAESAQAAPKKKKAARKTAPPKQPITSIKPSSAPPVSPKQNRSAKTAAKQARLQKSGVTSRTRGHVSAQTRKNQSKRDSRG